MEIKPTLDFRTINDRLRNSLTGILGNVYFLNDESLTEEQRSFVNAILDCANDLNKLADEMLGKKEVNNLKYSMPFRL